MCRFAAYLGEPILIEDLLYEPDGALVHQAVDTELMSLLNLGGFGLAAWDPAFPDPTRPLTYRVPTLPSFDRNLRALAGKVRAHAMVAHVRGSCTTAVRASGRTTSTRSCSTARLRARPERRPARLLADALRPARPHRPEAAADDRGHDRHRVGVCARPLPAAGPVRADRTRGGRGRRRAAAFEILRELRARRGIASSPRQPGADGRQLDARHALRVRLRLVSGRRLVLRVRARARLHLSWYTAGGRFGRREDGSFGSHRAAPHRRWSPASP